MIQKIHGGNLGPVLVAKPWGYERIIGTCSHVALKEVRLDPGEAFSRQVHTWKFEIYFVLAGGGRLELGRTGDLVHILSQGDAALIKPGMIHRVIAGAEGITIVEASTPEINDGIRIEDAHGRTANSDFDESHYFAVLSN